LIRRWGLLALLSAASIGPQCASAHEGHAALPSKGLTVVGNELLLSEGARKAIDLATAKVTLADLARSIECNARVELPWSQQAMVTTQVPGRIKEVLVRPGDGVQAGQELARLESLELEALQLAMLQADAELALAQDQFQRRSSLASQGVIAGRDATDTEASVRQKTAELEVALCKLRGLGLDQNLLDGIRTSRRPIASFSIVSPIDGILADADVRIGAQVKTTEHLFHVVDLSTLWVIGSVLEGDIAQIQEGQPVTITFKSLPEQTISGTIDSLRLKMDEAHRTRDVAVIWKNPDGSLRPGLFGRMAIQISESPEAVVAPTEAIIADRGSQYVLLNRGAGKYIRQPVDLGIRNHDQVEVVEGLFPGDQVVITGNHVLFSLFGGTPTNTATQANAAGDKADADQNALAQASLKQDHRDDAIVVQGVVELPTDRKAFAGSRIEGRIGRIFVEHSQPVEAGQVLAEVESLELRNMQGELLATEAKLAWTSQRVDRLAPLAQQNLTSRNELWQLQSDERVLSAKRDSVLRTLSMIGIRDEEAQRVLTTDLSSGNCDLTLVRSLPIRAPIAGAVADFDIVPGQVVDSQSTLFEIHDASKVWVKGYVFQPDAARVQIGQGVRLTFASDPNATVEGKVVRLSPVLDSTARVLPLWVEVDNADGRLIEGMWARMEIEVGQPPLAATSDAPQTSSAIRVFPVIRAR
jgi:RND family efflux transporter MFP subunit